MTFAKGQSGNPAGRKGQHGHYHWRTRTCDACGQEYRTQKINSRFCSTPCRTSHGAWSYAANQQANPRTLGVARP